MLRGFHVKVYYYDVMRQSHEQEKEHQVSYLPLEELLSCCDILSVHAPLTDTTRGMIGEKELRRMKPGSILINTSRGGVVEECALIEALQNGTIRAAGLDSFTQEPLDPNSPLLLMDQVVTTCHYGGSTVDNILPRIEHAYRNIVRFEQGGGIEPSDLIVAP